jgi:uncharacterized protein YndB with AHSA1/START domain
MTATIESTVVIARPVDQVFASLLDLENAAYFDPDVQTVRKTTEGPIGPGTEFRFYERTPPFGRFHHTSVRYTAIEPNRRIAFTARVGELAPSGGFLFEPVGPATRVTFRGEANPRGVMRLFAPLVSRQGRKVWDKRLDDFKGWLEKE